MKQLGSLGIILGIILGISISANASLIDNGDDGTITQIRDDGKQLMWLKLVNYKQGDMWIFRTWNSAMQWASDLDFAGYTDWRLPSALNADDSGPCSGFSCTSELGLMFAELGGEPGRSIWDWENSDPDRFLFTNLLAAWYWSGTENNSNSAWLFDLSSGSQWADEKTYPLSAWAVRDIPIPVPEPTTLILIVSSLGGIVLSKRWIKR